ncbi:hypothetical protein D5272_19345, partial [bacterium D16-76]|nr:hypothetical protein [bacterium D16-76]
TCYNIFAPYMWQPATGLGHLMPKLLEWKGNGLANSSKSKALVKKSVSHPPIRSVRFVQVEQPLESANR